MKKLVSILVGTSMLLSFSASAFASTATVTQSVNFRSAPSMNSNVYNLLKVGTTLNVLDHVNPYWLKVTLNGKVGYVSAHYVQETKIPTPTLTANVSQPTNDNVIVTITYPNSATKKEFRINGGAWTSYSSPVAMTANGLVEARGADQFGNVSQVSSYTVSNIDKIAPAIPTFIADKTTPTNENITLAITYSEDSSSREVRVNGGSWTSYSAPITVTANSLIEARAIDHAGNISSVGSHEVNNIDKTPPAVPTITADKTSVTNQDVTVTITYPVDSVLNEYRVNSGPWTMYSAPVVMSTNAPVEARSTDAAGNVSTIGSYTVNNIDKTTIGEKIVNTAMTFQGKVTYKFGVRDIPNLILDCSSFTQYVFKLNGINIPWGSKLQGNSGVYVPKDNLQPGDLVFFSVSDPTQINHVGIYIGNDQFINNLPNKGIVISNLNSTYWTNHYLTARRIDI